MRNDFSELFSLKDSIAVVTGGGGVLCSAMSVALANAGVKVAVLDISLESAESVVEKLSKDGLEVVAIQCDVLSKASVENAAKLVLNRFGRVDILINGAGGNKKEATTSEDLSFFDLPADTIQWVFNLNFLGTLLPCQVFGKIMAESGEGAILNISSMSAFRPLTRIPAYSGAKASISNFTQWLAVHLAKEYSPKIRVNALAPGFFLTDQNRFLLTDENSGNLTPRGQQIIDHTPQARFGEPEDLLGAMFWLLSSASQFVTGVVLPVDGGFSAYSGV